MNNVQRKRYSRNDNGFRLTKMLTGN